MNKSWPSITAGQNIIRRYTARQNLTTCPNVKRATETSTDSHGEAVLTTMEWVDVE